MNIPWLKSIVEAYRSSSEQGRPAHAILLTGAPGTGKRAAAAWLVRQHLALADDGMLPQHPFTVPVHADLHWIRPPEDKHSIGIEQIRKLVGEFSLTSYSGDGKAAVIEPADVLTNSAANSLLKTLEEPPGNSLLVLVADRLGRLPATIFSRCQRYNVQAPAAEIGLQWLQELEPGTAWEEPLRSTGLAPLAALSAQLRLDESESLAIDFAAVADGRAAPLPVAAKWAKYEPDFVFNWISRQIQSCILQVSGAASGAGRSVIGDSVLARIDRRNLFCYLDIINRLRGQPAGSFNVQLTLECLLIDWAANLKSVLETE